MTRNGLARRGASDPTAGQQVPGRASIGQPLGFDARHDDRLELRLGEFQAGLARG